jgi:hypothetical protein
MSKPRRRLDKFSALYRELERTIRKEAAKHPDPEAYILREFERVSQLLAAIFAASLRFTRADQETRLRWLAAAGLPPHLAATRWVNLDSEAQDALYKVIPAELPGDEP